MTTTLTTIRGRVRKDLRDTDASDYRWDDDQLDRHIQRALRDLSLALPREATADVATTPGSRTIALDSLAGLIAVEEVEYPAGDDGALRLRFSTWDSSLTIVDEIVPDGSDARVRYTAAHVLDDQVSTVPAALEDILATGASGYAAMEIAAFSIDRLNNDGDASERYAAWAQAWLVAFRELLRYHGRSRRLRTGRIARPA